MAMAFAITTGIAVAVAIAIAIAITISLSINIIREVKVAEAGVKSFTTEQENANARKITKL